MSLVSFSPRRAAPKRALCYKPSTSTDPIREVPVRYSKALRWCNQMSLFHPRPTTPQWTDLPAEARRQTLSLLGRLLRLHRRGRVMERSDREVCDE